MGEELDPENTDWREVPAVGKYMVPLLLIGFIANVPVLDFPFLGFGFDGYSLCCIEENSLCLLNAVILLHVSEIYWH